MELGIKDKRFKHQNEARVIVNTDKEKIKEVLKKPIKIGSLRDVADVKNIYLYEGMNV